MTTAADVFATWGLGLSADDVPARARVAAARLILDGIGCAMAASRSGEMTSSTAVARSFTAPQEATIIGGGARVPAPAAALANGALIHALDFDDTHADALVHATAAVLPAALAVGEERGASGADVLVAAIAGYEVVCRLGMAVRHGFHARGFHATSVCGVFASALVSARLMGLDHAATVNALGIAGSMAAGSLEFLQTGSDTKQLHPGFSGQAGIIAARMAAAGATGPNSIFEGEHGLFRAYTDTRVDPAMLTDGLGRRWEVERITIKPYPACQLSHASLDALAAIRSLDPLEIERITFDLPKDSVDIVAEPAATKAAPRTPYEGKFSLPYSAAALVLDGGLGVDSFGRAQIERPYVRELAARVTYRSIDPGVAAADAPGRVEVALRGGSTVTGEVEHSRGGPNAPLTDDEIRDKCGLDPAMARTILDLDRLPAVADLMEMLT